MAGAVLGAGIVPVVVVFVAPALERLNSVGGLSQAKKHAENLVLVEICPVTTAAVVGDGIATGVAIAVVAESGVVLAAVAGFHSDWLGYCFALEFLHPACRIHLEGAHLKVTASSASLDENLEHDAFEQSVVCPGMQNLRKQLAVVVALIDVARLE